MNAIASEIHAKQWKKYISTFWYDHLFQRWVTKFITFNSLQNAVKETFHTTITTYGKLALEAFNEEFLLLLIPLSDSATTLNDLHKRLNVEGETADFCTWYMHILTACHLKSDPDRFASPSILHGKDCRLLPL